MLGLQRGESSDSLLANGARSEYVKRYQVHPLQKRQNFKPNQEPARGEGKVESVTVTRRDFPEHPVQKRQIVKPADNSLVREGPQDFTSIYQKEYPEHHVEKRKPYRADIARPELAAFDAQPSYREDYPEWDIPKRQPREKLEWHPPDQPFVANTTNMNDYQEHQISPRVSHRPDMKPVQSDVPFNASSDYRDTFREHPIPPKVAREKEQWTQPTVPMDSTTTNQKDYRGEYVPKQKSMRRDLSPVRSDVPLEGNTTTSLSYQPHELPKRYQRQREQYQPPEGQMESSSISHMQYREHPLQKPEIRRPESSHLLRGSGVMAKDTNYNKDFQGHPIDKRALVKPKREYNPPTVPMESQTEYTSDYYARNPGPRTNFKPKDAPMHSDQPFDDRTDYREKFTEHKLSPRQLPTKEVYSGPTAPFDSKTTAGESYLGQYQAKRESFKPDQNPYKSTDPFEASTTTNSDFKAHQVQRRQINKRESYHKPEGNMDLMTIHNTHYTEHPLSKHKIEKPGSSHLLRGTGEMSNQTNYQGDYVQRPIERRKIMKPDSDYHPPEHPMNTETTHRADFLERQAKQRESFKPRYEPPRSDVPLDGRTGYRDAFIEHKITPREKRAAEVHKPPSAPLDDRTTVRESYKGTYQARRENFKPDRNPIHSDSPFDGSTTMNSDFRQHKLPERHRHQPESYHRPEGQMDLTTTNNVNYKEHALSKPVINRPGSSGLLKGFGEMKKESHYQGDFKQPPAVRRELVKPHNEYKPPSAPMDAVTTAQMSYKEHGLSPRTNFKPRNDYQKPDVPFDDRTDYKDKFTEHGIAPRQPKPKETYQPSSAPLDSRTTNNQSYIGTYQPKRESFRPDRNYVKSDLPLESNTTSNTAFKQWPLAERQRHKQDEYTKPDGFMDLTTINRETYKEMQVKRQPLQRLGSSHLLDKAGKFEATTSYSNDFIPKSLEGRKVIKPDNAYVPPAMPFDAKTEYRATHVGYVAPKERSFKPDLNSDTLGQRDANNIFRIRDRVWPTETTVQG